MTDNSRWAGLVPDLSGKRVFQAGASGGSPLGINFARAGIDTVFADHGRVKLETLPRTAFTLDDIGEFKVDALAKFVARAAPGTKVMAIPTCVQEALTDESLEAFGRPDLIIAATDSLDAQAYVNRFALRHGIPAILIDVHERGLGGMITVIMRGWPCYFCIARRRFELQQEGQVPIDLPGARGMGADIAFIDAIVLKVALAVLSRGTDTDYGRFFKRMENRSQIIVRCHPDFRFGEADLFDVVLADLPTQPKDFKAELQSDAFFACDTLWLRPEFDPQCPHCQEFRGLQ